MTPSEDNAAGPESAAELLSRRTQLQEWLRRLDEVGEDIPAQVARRVRTDYEERLTAVVAELSAHFEVLSADRDILDEKLLAAAERHDVAVDALEETRLRHLIGELSQEDWDSRRPALESELEDATAGRQETEREIEALEELLAQLNVGVAANDPLRGAEEELSSSSEAASSSEAFPYEASGAGATGFADGSDEWMPELPVLEAPALGNPEQLGASVDAESPGTPDEVSGEVLLDVSAYGEDDQEGLDDDLVEITTFAAAAEALADELDTEPADDDYAFLQELDRAIAATAPSSPEEEDSAATRPQPGLKCPDCGYSNDPAAWYCGVCGVDLG